MSSTSADFLNGHFALAIVETLSRSGRPAPNCESL